MAEWNDSYKPQVMKATDMNLIDGVFGMRFVEHDIVELYIEDDDNYFFKTRFNIFWLTHLRDIAQNSINRVNQLRAERKATGQEAKDAATNECQDRSPTKAG